MKILTMVAAASLAAFACAAENEPAPAPAPGDVPKAVARPRAGGALPRAAMRGMGQMMQDPIVRAVSNPKIAEKIGLTAEQKAKLGDASALRAKSRELNEKARKATMRQMELLQAETIDEAAVMAAIDEAFEARKELAKEQTKRLIVVRSVLTPEQVKMIREEMMAMRSRGGKPGARRGAQPPPPPPKDEPKDDAPKAE